MQTIIAQSEASGFVKRTPVESVMRNPNNLTSEPKPFLIATSWRPPVFDLAKIAPLPPAPAIPVFNASDFTQEEMLALMSSSEALRHISIFFGLRERDKLGPLSGKTFDSLRERGYVTRPDGRRFHKLTTKGIQIANAVADHLVATTKLHWSYAGHTGRRSEGYVACCCGWRRGISTFNLQANANRAFTTHLRELAEKSAAT